jgi:hypothetical protein
MSIIEAEVIGHVENLPGTIDDKVLRLETAKPMEEFTRMVEAGARFGKVKIETADLEAVFLNLTGRRLRD